MNLTQQMPTFARWYRSLLAIPLMPHVAFLVASVIGTAVTPVCMLLKESAVPELLVFILFVPLWLPVVAGDLAILYWHKKQPLFRPSLLLRFLILGLVMEGLLLFLQYEYPPQSAYDETKGELVLQSIYGVQCVLLLVLEPVLRWLLRRQVKAEDDRIVIH
ncbi:hypothetical protein Pan153_30240 [Gimesia panareensis]|uniref:Uncharacterized protein n=1 Tax=Gimesia panareensis TaxID=2527978 RepID=A0A518FPV6_9PLAN|nr:hypothetical protein [Gimesia panareensis]QDV18367.1 hypothetical protein Pan153_30240 [Gimesia panareensis]